jgi:hypothetical protein
MQPIKFKKLRERVQKKFGLNITDGQKLCAETVGHCIRSWQQWELGERNPRASTTDYAVQKIEGLLNHV